MLAEKLKVTAVSYLNTKPLLYGLLHHPVQSEIDLQLDIPSVCAQRLRDGDADLGLIPVAAIPELEQPYIISDYCIGATGVVKTVAIFSEVPIEEMTHLYLDYHSRTSVQLAQVLLREYWQVQPELIQATPGFEREIGGTKGAVIIGDRTMGLMVDAVSDILAVPEDDLQPPPDLKANSERSFISVLMIVENRMIRVLDLDAVLPPPNEDAA